jgi:hypothetical protein
MKQILIAVLLSGLLWPGTGQMYNREFAKGLVLILLTFLFGLSLLMGAGAEILQKLPADGPAWDTSQVQQILEQIRLKNAGLVTTFNLLMTVTWVYGVVDAYLGAKDRLTPPPGEKDTEDAAE